ncbi:Carbonic anhydrase- protein 10 [Dermatophagoides pteronyssinus]|uniref:Carbonic anhydrase- protein 10 n=1 Tax=Dermatophagoides pteronyssinus TaxID=6956 RepID=A0ABQ8J1J0_DERPT|nr:Carbonic anhydrase- protein 10 [Dermatophagoides pteronyssinus]
MNRTNDEQKAIKCDWNFWWTYDGISGPEFWGILNPDWFLCSKGHRQSPIDIKPGLLLYDPNLKSIFINKNKVNGYLENDGHSVVFHSHYQQQNQSDTFNQQNSNSNQMLPVTINGGPLSYSYLFHSLHIHFGLVDSYGSEHLISGFQFPGEIQLIGYNSDLYDSYADASTKPNGLVGIAIFLKQETKSSPEIEILTSQLNQIVYRGQKTIIKSLSLRDLLPDDQNYITYDGSLTTPSCDEIVTWIVINKPLSITKEQLQALRFLMQGDIDVPKAPLGNNFRPTQSINDRVIRTNIEFKQQQQSTTKGKNCPTMKQNVQYEINQKLWNVI